jgi:hypothetical protein
MPKDFQRYHLFRNGKANFCTSEIEKFTKSINEYTEVDQTIMMCIEMYGCT